MDPQDGDGQADPAAAQLTGQGYGLVEIPERDEHSILVF